MLCWLTSISPLFSFDICKAKLKMCAFPFFFCFSLLLPSSICLSLCLSLPLSVCVCLCLCMCVMYVCVYMCVLEWGGVGEMVLLIASIDESLRCELQEAL